MFRGSGSVRLFRVFGFEVRVDASWFLLLFLMIYVLSGPFRSTLHSSDTVAYITTVVSVLALFASLILHELGHALVARHQGIAVPGIDLYLFGGLTEMSHDPVTPGDDFRVSVAGPLATLAVIAVCVAIDLALVGGHRLTQAIELDSDIHITPVLMALSWLIPVNTLLLAFNLLPAFPLDGGRIARAAVWRVTGDKHRGTLVSARMGQVLAILLAAAGLWILLSLHSFGGLYTIVLGYILYSSARAALASAALSERIDGVRISDVMDPEPLAISEELPVSQAVQEYFWRYRQPWFPVVNADGVVVGLAYAAALQAVFDAGEGWLLTGSVADHADPGTWQVRADRPVAELFGAEPLRRLGAVVVVGPGGILRGIVTADQVRRVLSAAVGRSAA